MKSIFLGLILSYSTLVYAQQNLPYKVDNSENKFMRPIFKQFGPSCQAAAWVGNMFNYELNLRRNIPSDSMKNLYPVYFTYNFGSKNFETALENGIPTSDLYGDERKADDNTIWPTGYDLYFEAMKNRVAGRETFKINSPEGLNRLKRWLYNHDGENNLPHGGVSRFWTHIGNWKIDTIPAGLYMERKKILNAWGKRGGHIMTWVGYDDSVAYDLNKDGIITNNIDINNDGIVDMLDWERGALIALNTWGKSWANDGKIYVPYRLCVDKKYNENGATAEIIYFSGLTNYHPKLTAKIKMTHELRNAISIRVGVSQNMNATEPEFEKSFAIFNHGKPYRGKSDVPMLGSGNFKPMEFGLDISDLLKQVDHSRNMKFFLRIKSDKVKDSDPQGKVLRFSILSYQFDKKGVEYISVDRDINIPEDTITSLSVIMPGNKLHPPFNLSAIQSQHTVKLNWNTPLKSPYPLIGYQLYKNNVLLAKINNKETSYIDNSGSNAAYQIKAIYKKENRRVTSVFSNRARIINETENQCLHLDGKRKYLKLPSYNLFSSRGFTFETWVKLTDSLTSNAVLLACIKGSSKAEITITKNMEISYKWALASHKPGRNEYTSRWSSKLKVPVNKWTYLAMVIFPDSTVFYLNDEQAVHKRKNPIDNFNFETYIGVNPQWGGSGIIGYIDELRFWKRPLSKEEIEKKRNQELISPQTENALLAYYDFNNSNGEIVFDAVNNYDGKLCADLNQKNIVYSDVFEVYPKEKPTAKFEFETKGTFEQQDLIKFFSKNSTGKPTLWEWQFEGGEPEYSNAKNPVVRYKKPGKYTVGLTVSNSMGSTFRKETGFIQILEKVQPTACFTIPNEPIHVGDSVFFNNINVDNIEEWEWTFEGATNNNSNSQNPLVIFNQEGEHSISLVAKNGAGENKRRQIIMVKGPRPVVKFDSDRQFILKNEYVQFTDYSSSNSLKWKWEFEGGIPATSSEQNPRVMYANPGIYSVKLTVYSKDCESSITTPNQITVSNEDAGHALNFTGDSMYIRTNKIFAEPIPEFTIEWWIKPDKRANWNQQIGPGWDRFLFHANFDGSVSAGIYGSGLTRINSKPNVIEVGVWQHYAFTFKKGEFKLYKNGQVIGMASSKIMYTPPWKTLYIGRSGKSRSLTGNIDEFRIWDKALSKKQLLANMNSKIEKPEKSKNLILYYDFNTINGNKIIDLKGNHEGKFIKLKKGKRGYQQVDIKPEVAEKLISTSNAFCIEK